MLKIAIDAGHYKGTPGRRCLAALDPSETREWELNRRVADKLEELLAGYDCQVLRVDDKTGDKRIDLGDRVAAANGWPADVYLSIHHNAGIKGGSGGGCVVYTAPDCQAKSKALQKAVYGAVVSRTGLVGNRATPMMQPVRAQADKNARYPDRVRVHGQQDGRSGDPWAVLRVSGG